MRMPGFGPQLSGRILRLFFPNRCFLCGELVEGEALCCPDCRKLLPDPPGKRKMLAGAWGCAALPYEGAVRETLHRFKFQEERWLAQPLAKEMAAALEDFGSWDAVCWAPMSPMRKLRRGYDQSELLAKEIAKLKNIPRRALLRKTRETAVQHELDLAGRLENVKEAYAAKEDCSGLRLLVVDDIVTSGATLSECIRVLRQAGAAEVTWAAAAGGWNEKKE